MCSGKTHFQSYGAPLVDQIPPNTRYHPNQPTPSQNPTLQGNKYFTLQGIQYSPQVVDVVSTSQTAYTNPEQGKYHYPFPTP